MYLSERDMMAGHMNWPWVQFYSQLSAILKASPAAVFEVISGTFTDNDPSAGYVAWVDLAVKHDGKVHYIADSNSRKKWIYWTLQSSRTLQASYTYPTTGVNLYIVGSNDAGTFTLLSKSDLNILDLEEQPVPDAPSADTARLYVQDNGAGKTQLCVRFPTGAVQVISTEP